MTEPPMISPMTPNPGGIIDPDNLVDREDALSQLLEAAGNQGAYVTGDRRMGKTSLLRKAEEQLRAVGHIVVRTSAETSSLDTFTTELLRAVRQEGNLHRRVNSLEREVGGELTVKALGSGLKISGRSKTTGKETEEDLLGLCADVARKSGPCRLILIIDEIAVLATHLADASPGAGSDFLHSLRRARQNQDKVSIILAGSLGLHHALPDLSSLNDLRTVHIGPLPHHHARTLARCLILGVYGRDDAKSEKVADHVAREVGDVPYYIHALLDMCSHSWNELPTPDVITQLISTALRSNAWNTEHYFDRLGPYYGEDRDLVIEILDLLARTDAPLSLTAIASELAAADLANPPSREKIGELLRKLRLDHYTTVDSEGHSMASPFMRRIWTAVREIR